jgi:hypothetical protein
MSVMVVLYGLAMIAVAKHVNTTLRTSLSLSHRNSQLIGVLTESTARTEALNRSLECEVTERRQKELALRQSEAMLADAQRMAHLGSWTYNPAAHAAVWSAETFRIYGTERHSFLPGADRGSIATTAGCRIDAPCGGARRRDGISRPYTAQVGPRAVPARAGR